MAMDPGTAYPKGSRSGLAGALMNAIETVLPENEFPNENAEQLVGRMMLGIATAIIDQIVNNAEISLAVDTGIACYVDDATHQGETYSVGTGTGTIT